MFRATDELLNKFLHRPAERSLLLRRIHAVAVQLDEYPIWLTRHGNRGSLPKVKTMETGGICSRQRRVIDAKTPWTML